MGSQLIEIFKNNELVNKIKKRLPYLFQLAELEASRAGKIGMEIGSVRERIIIALLIYKFGEQNVDTNIPITKPEADLRLFNQPISIKTISGKNLGGVKLIWTVDAQKAKEFLEKYYPICDMLLVQINWNGIGGLYYIPLEVQIKYFKKLGKSSYIKLPKAGTNPRGVEITKEALALLINDRNAKSILVQWNRVETNTNSYKRWVDLWMED